MCGSDEATFDHSEPATNKAKWNTTTPDNLLTPQSHDSQWGPPAGTLWTSRYFLMYYYFHKKKLLWIFDRIR